jgi:hypothetical protein
VSAVSRTLRLARRKPRWKKADVAFNETREGRALAITWRQFKGGSIESGCRTNASNRGELWTTKDIAAIRHLGKAGAMGLRKSGRHFRLYPKASFEGISLPRTPTIRGSAMAEKARGVAA